MKAERIVRNFWVKAAAFLLAALLVPVMVAYGFAFVLSGSGTLGSSFYDSELCWSAASQCSVARYFSFGGWSDRTEQEDFWGWIEENYPAQDSTTNVRFALFCNGDLIYDNHRADDVCLSRGSYYYRPDRDTEIMLNLYVDPALPAQDGVAQAARLYSTLAGMAGHAVAALLLCALAELFLVILLARTAGRRPGVDAPARGWQEHIPLDLYLTADILVSILLAELVVEGVLYNQIWTEFSDLATAAVLGIVFVGAVLLLGLWMTFCTRVKLGKWWRNTVICMLLRLIWRIVKLCWRGLTALCRGILRAIRVIPMVWRTLLGGTVLTILLTCLAAAWEPSGWTFCITAALTLLACWIALQLRRLQKAGQALAAGDLAAQVDTRGMVWDLKRHGEDLNAVGRGMAIAVEEQLRSERLKTELITNVSHDIKTPLTSIINYVDLLQRDHTPEQETEYLAVLERQAKKLKKLTEDLVEMSKASAGAIPCRPAPRRVGELVEQAVGEYADRLAAAGLEPVISLPEQDLTCLADGALIWRVLDNLLGNACKYAQPGTRLYIEGRADGGTVTLSFKNISREALNISADELMERFVRGDTSRSTEGSGLGLNIARSLMELQGGDLRLDIDADLFKAFVTLPRAVD